MRILISFLLLICSINVHAQDFSPENYLARFMKYWQWSQNLPQNPDADFLAFIDGDSPLSKRLREKWLYQLAQQKDWQRFSLYYKPSNDISLQCYWHLALYSQGQMVFAKVRPLWLTADSQPGACNQLFTLFMKSPNFDEKLIGTRIHLALEKRNLGLALYLLRQYKNPRIHDVEILQAIAQNPLKVNQLTPGSLHDAFYLYGLKRLVSINMPKAISYWQQPLTRKILTPAQQQSFLVHLVIYKSMRNNADTYQWFTKIAPEYYSDLLLDWQIRAALKEQNWARVKKLIAYSSARQSPCWQYWLARALAALGKTAEATAIYEQLAQLRNYYGFLASWQLHKKPQFVNEPLVVDPHLLASFQQITTLIKSLYINKQILQASRLLNDFLLELPKREKSAVLAWVANDLQWHAKTVYLSSTEEMSNQLGLRFPLAHAKSVTDNARTYHIAQEFIYAIIRQESCFREDVVSQAGARGLMQLMPETALQVAKREKINYRDKGQLFLSEKNISLGTAYLKQLAQRFRQHPVLIAAAYNAGPHQVNYWLKNHPPKEMDIWIETLPWQETRNYLKNILAFYAVYQYRMQQKPDLKAFMQPL